MQLQTDFLMFKITIQIMFYQIQFTEGVLIILRSLMEPPLLV